jgi:hypothetical protein
MGMLAVFIIQVCFTAHGALDSPFFHATTFGIFKGSTQELAHSHVHHSLHDSAATVKRNVRKLRRSNHCGHEIIVVIIVLVVAIRQVRVWGQQFRNIIKVFVFRLVIIGFIRVGPFQRRPILWHMTRHQTWHAIVVVVVVVVVIGIAPLDEARHAGMGRLLFGIRADVDVDPTDHGWNPVVLPSSLWCRIHIHLVKRLHVTTYRFPHLLHGHGA